MSKRLRNDEIRKAIDIFKYSVRISDDYEVLKMLDDDLEYQDLMIAAVLEVTNDVSTEIASTYQNKKGWFLCGDSWSANNEIKEILSQVSMFIMNSRSSPL